MNTRKRFVWVLIPAQNEQDVIEAAIRGLCRQTIAPDLITVLADNCTDETIRVAREAGADDVRITRNNKHKKAGALNAALEEILADAESEGPPWALSFQDCILIQDADTVLAPEFIESALRELDAETGAIGGVFYGESGGGLLGQLQRSEYTRYARQTSRDRDTVRVLSGTASMFLVSTLIDVRAARKDGRLPESAGVYDVHALTEDNELTLALKTLGYKPLSPPDCRVVTEVMPTFRQLWRQRLRWQRGALENLRAYGWRPSTRSYILRQVLAFFGACALALYFAYLPLALTIVPKVRRRRARR